MNHLSRLICCNNEMECKEKQEIELLKEVECEGLPNLDDSNHWTMDNNSLIGAADDVQFIFGGPGSHWLGVEEDSLINTSNPDSFLQCNGSDELVFTGTDDGYDMYDSDSESDNIDKDDDDILKIEFAVNNSRDSDRAELSAVSKINAMIHSSTDPVGKFLRQRRITATMAVDLNIHKMLLHAPKTPRQKYGPRHEQTVEERLQQCKDRNRAHAKATRQRKKLFEKIVQIVENPSLRCSSIGGDIEDEEEMSVQS